MRLFKYGMRLRGFSLGCQPSGFIKVTDGSGRYYNFIYYGEKLSEDDERNYELDYLGIEII